MKPVLIIAAGTVLGVWAAWRWLRDETTRAAERMLRDGDQGWGTW